jgi:hypothetical protein
MDRGENVSAMEPLLIGETAKERGQLIDLAVALAAHAAGFRRSLPLHCGVQVSPEINSR